MKNKDALISIIVPIYNVAQYLPRCLDSLLHQTYSNLEIILVDDGSTDQSPGIIDQYLKKDPRFIAVRKKNGGLSDARNAGIEAAKGDFLIFVDSDDYVHQQFVELLYKTLHDTQSDIAVCEGVEIDEQHLGDILSPIPCSYHVDILDSIEGMKFWYTSGFRNPTVAWNKIYKRKLFASERFIKGKFHEDEFIMHHLFIKASKIAYLWAGLYFYVKHSGSITSPNTYSLNRLDVVEACEERWRKKKKIGDPELENLHFLHYIDILLGCSSDIIEKYQGPDQKKYLHLLQTKLFQAVNGRRPAFKQLCKIFIYKYSPHLYVKLYRKIKG